MAVGMFYVHGPRMSWTGVCEELLHGQYIHHGQWPKRNVRVHTLGPQETFTSLVEQKWWAYCYPEALHLPIGA